MALRTKVFSVAIEVTAQCQHKCAHCYNAWRNNNSAIPESASKLHARVEKLLASIDVDHLTITGGEPFVRSDLFDLLDRVKAKGVGIQIISNGSLIDDAIATRLAPYGVSYVQVALEGPTALLHDAQVGGVSGGKSPFDSTLRGIVALRRAGIPVMGCIVVTKKNATRIAEILAVFASLGVRHIALSRFSPAGYAVRHVAELLPSRDDLLVAFRQAIPFASTSRDKMRITCTMPVPPCAVEVEDLAPIRFGTCAIGTPMQEFALGPDGRLRHCTLHGSALGGAKDILEPDVDVAAIVTGSEVKDYKRVLPEFCIGCSHALSCNGGCGAASTWVLGSRKFPDPLVWQHVDDVFFAKLESQRSELQSASAVVASAL